MSLLRVEGTDKRANHRDDIEEGGENPIGEVLIHKAGFEVRMSALSQKRLVLVCQPTPANTLMSREPGPSRASKRSPEF